MKVTIEELEELVARGESTTVEFKETTGQRGEACRRVGLPLPVTDVKGGFVVTTFRRPEAAVGSGSGSNLDQRDPDPIQIDNGAPQGFGNRVANDVVNVVNGVVNRTTEQCETVNAIVGLIRQNNRISAAKIVQSLGMVNRTVQRVLKTLQTEGWLKRVGGTRGTWLVVEDHA